MASYLDITSPEDVSDESFDYIINIIKNGNLSYFQMCFSKLTHEIVSNIYNKDWC